MTGKWGLQDAPAQNPRNTRSDKMLTSVLNMFLYSLLLKHLDKVLGIYTYIHLMD